MVQTPLDALLRGSEANQCTCRRIIPSGLFSFGSAGQRSSRLPQSSAVRNLDFLSIIIDAGLLGGVLTSHPDPAVDRPLKPPLLPARSGSVFRPSILNTGGDTSSKCVPPWPRTTSLMPFDLIILYRRREIIAGEQRRIARDAHHISPRVNHAPFPASGRGAGSRSGGRVAIETWFRTGDRVKGKSGRQRVIIVGLRGICNFQLHENHHSAL